MSKADQTVELVAQRSGEIFILEYIKNLTGNPAAVGAATALRVAVDSLQKCSLTSNILWLCNCGEPRKWQFCHVHNAGSSVSMLRKVLG